MIGAVVRRGSPRSSSESRHRLSKNRNRDHTTKEEGREAAEADGEDFAMAMVMGMRG
jgi:hypothetical protein